MENKKKNISTIAIIIVIVVIDLSIIAWFAATKLQTSRLGVQQPTQIDKSTTAPTDWKIYEDKKYSYQLQYPNDWNLVSDSNNDPDAYNVTFWKGNGVDEDNIQIVKVIYSTNADGSVNDRESYLKMLASSDYSKVSVAGGQGYYFINETKGGSSPTMYIVGDEEIFLMSYAIFDSSKTALLESEELFKQIAGTFRFIK